MRTPIPTRESVAWFAEIMEAMLQEHDASRGPHSWTSADTEQILTLLVQHVGDLMGAHEAWKNGATSWSPVLRQAAHVGNFAMMLAELVQQRKDTHQLPASMQQRDLVALRTVIDQLEGQIAHHHHETLLVLHDRLSRDVNSEPADEPCD